MKETEQANTEVCLWADFIKGSDESLHQIYRRYVNPLYRYGCHFTNDHNLVKDSIHDVFVSLHQYRQNLSCTNNIRLYLFKSLKNKIIHSLTRNRIVEEPDQDFAPFFYSTSFEEKIIEDETKTLVRMRLKNAFTKLSHRQKEALYLKFVSELGYDEIGNILKVNYQSARNLVFRSLEKIREYHKLALIFYPLVFVEI